MKNKYVPFLCTFVTLLIVCLFINPLKWSYRSNFQVVTEDRPYGFEPVNCWFSPSSDWPISECYYMNVPEDHSTSGSKTISFPVVVFRSPSLITNKMPVLHLGAGGPGAPMYLDSTASIKNIWSNHDELSINQGRDLFIIDPRGTGLSKPLLMCDNFVSNQIERFKKNLSLGVLWKKINKDYFTCIERFKNQGIKLSTYNSLSIANDIEMMRKAARIDKWVLVGVSYAATYAQVIATKNPSSVESMILDSATFPSIKSHDSFIKRSMAGYEALYNYCLNDNSCSRPLPNLKKRIWSLHKQLNNSPIPMFIEHPYENKSIQIILNGERLLAAFIQGTYNEQIFIDLPKIITELETRKHTSITPYINDLAAYLLDKTYGDVSTISHYCYEDKPFTDFELIQKLAGKLPEGYIRSTTLLALEQPDYCDEIQIESVDPIVSMPTRTDIPVLFLHGELDSITLLSNVIKQKKAFINSTLIRYQLSHDILGSSECAEIAAAKFIKGYKMDMLTCEEI